MQQQLLCDSFVVTHCLYNFCFLFLFLCLCFASVFHLQNELIVLALIFCYVDMKSNIPLLFNIKDFFFVVCFLHILLTPMPTMDDKIDHMILTCCIRSLVNLMQQTFFATTPITNFNLLQPRCLNDNKQVSIIHVIVYCCQFLCFQKFSQFEMLSFDLGHWVEPTNTIQFFRFLLLKFDKTSGRKKLYGQNQIVLYCKNTKSHHSKAKHQMGVVFLMCMVLLMAFTFQL